MTSKREQKPFGVFFATEPRDPVTGQSIYATGGGASSSATGASDTSVTENKYNLVRVAKAEDIPLGESWKNLAHRLATAGYSAPPEGYEVPTLSFLTSLVKKLGNTAGLTSSPTADKGSIDAISTTVAHAENAPLTYVTAEGYVGYIDPAKFPEHGIDSAKYHAAPKFVLPTNEEYSRATSVVSNSFLATGGRDATVGDFVNAIDAGNKVIILDNKLVKADVWDSNKNRPNNASAYLARKIAGDASLPFLPGKGFTQEFLDQHAKAISSLVKVVTIVSEADIPRAVGESVQFLNS